MSSVQSPGVQYFLDGLQAQPGVRVCMQYCAEIALEMRTADAHASLDRSQRSRNACNSYFGFFKPCFSWSDDEMVKLLFL